ncbi:MAG: hypothetical protein P1Q69_02200 [Candidatus Thorarchaeota archaeon]|nr:hypothetical protein [Candidatus Thorarchaeota archaeon]
MNETAAPLKGVQEKEAQATVISKKVFVSFFAERKNTLILCLVAIIATSATCIHYLLVLLDWTVIGFNLDDSWIHLEYARSIYEGRAWEYSPGYPSTGSTSPLWSIVLSIIFFFTSDPASIVWGVMIVSWILYFLCTFTVGYFVSDLTESLLIGSVSMIVFVVIPSNTWLMLSGMEYPLFMLLLLLPLILMNNSGSQFDAALGLVAGLAFLARSEGILLALIAVPIRIIQHVNARDFTRKRLVSILSMFGIAASVALPWILYCISVTGYPLPDTFYAKVGVISDTDVEAWNIFWTAFFGTMPFVLMGLILGVLSLLKKRPYAWLLGISMTLLYRFTMPYQALINNSRYITPIFGFLAISCVVGFGVHACELIKSDKRPNARMYRVLISTLLVLLIVVPSVPLYLNQADLFGNATKNINEMQVDIGYWVAENTPEDSVLALGDVGATRFISNRTIIDLCGLVTPDIAHGNFTPGELVNYLETRDADYLIIFGKWHGFYNVLMGQHMTELYRVELDDNRICGDDTMVVYEITW